MMAGNDLAENLFTKAGAVLHGHFLLTSGLHSPVYWEKFRILENPEYTSRLCQMIANHFSSHAIQVVIGPTTGGVIIAHEVARFLGIRGIFAEKLAGTDKRALKRGFRIQPGEKVLLVDDVLTTGKSIRQVEDVILDVGGTLAGIGVLVDRSGGHFETDVPLFACIRSEEITYEANNCPLCASGIELVKPGSS